MRISVFLFIAVCTVCVCDNYKDKSKIQIGVKKRSACKERTKKGDLVEVFYKGFFENGHEFDRSPAERPFSFALNAGQVIKGWDQGLMRMCVGDVRKLVIPPELAYGIDGIPPYIPSNSTLIYEIELLSIEPRERY